MPPIAQQSPEELPPPASDDDASSWLTDAFVAAALGEASPPAALTLERATGKGDNFLSVLHRVRADFTTPRHLIVKSMPPGEFMQQFITESGVFEREVVVYSALPDMYAFADARRASPFPRFSTAFYRVDRPYTLVFDDLRHQGYTMADRRTRLDLAHCELVVAAQARLHALSAVYDEHNPGFLDKFVDIMYCESNRQRLGQFMPPQAKDCAKEVRKWPGFEAIAEKMAAQESVCVDKTIEVCKRKEGARIVLLHGDSWVNNLMFNYSDAGEPLDLKLIDFQLTRYGSPALDLLYFLVSSPRGDVRIASTDALLDLYVEEFNREARALGMRAEPLTREELSGEMSRCLYFGFMSALTTLGVVLAEPDDTMNLEDITNEDAEKGDLNPFEKVYASERFKKAIMPLLKEFDENGVFD